MGVKGIGISMAMMVKLLGLPKGTIISDINHANEQACWRIIAHHPEFEELSNPLSIVGFNVPDHLADEALKNG